MKWFIAMLAGALSGWLIAFVTDEVAIASASGAAIGVLATIALFGTRPALSVFKAASAMAIGSLAGWLVASLTDHLAIAMVIGSVVGVLATIAVASERPARALLKVVGVICLGFAIGWGIGTTLGDHKVGVTVGVLLSLPLLLLLADKISQPRHRPF